jgi:hypothetical protein
MTDLILTAHLMYSTVRSLIFLKFQKCVTALTELHQQHAFDAINHYDNFTYQQTVARLTTKLSCQTFPFNSEIALVSLLELISSCLSGSINRVLIL